MKTLVMSVSLLISLSLNSLLFADSPLTSTPFSKDYQNESIIIEASKTQGRLTDELMNYLINDSNPIDIKMALINELGWDTHKENNPDRFQKYVPNVCYSTRYPAF